MGRWVRLLLRPRLAPLVLLSFAAAQACAATVQIGRASTDTSPGQDWQVHSLATHLTGITSGVDGQMHLATTAMWLLSPRGEVDAVLVFEGSKDSYAGRLQWSPSCEGLKPSPVMFVRNQWRNMWSEWRDDCLVVAGSVDLRGAIERTNPAVAALLEQHAVKIGRFGSITRATVAQNGTYLTAWLFATSSFRGSKAALTVDPGPSLVPPTILQWGVELSEAVRSSTLSLSGRFKLPAIEFDHPGDASAPVATDRTVN